MRRQARVLWGVLRPRNVLQTLPPGGFTRYPSLACARSSFCTSALNPESVSYLLDSTSQHEVYLLGTSHVSETSADEVRKVIETVKPDRVMVELCQQRARRLRSGQSTLSGKDIVQQLLEALLHRNSRPGFGVECLLKLGFTGFYALFRQYGLVPGLEFKVALEEADRRGLPICCGDADVDRTISQLGLAVRQMSFARLLEAPPVPPELEELLGSINLSNLSGSIEKLKNRSHITLFRDHMSLVMPEFMDVMVHRRDVLMTENLLRESRQGRVVAVVGMAHMDGIEHEWQKHSGQVFIHEKCSLRSRK